MNAVDVLYVDGPRVPMADGAVYNIKATQAGFELEPEGDLTKNLANRILSGEATACEPNANAAPVGTPANPNPVAPTSPPEQVQPAPAQTTTPPG